MMTAPPRRPLALTLGEPSGLGLDLTLQAWCARRRLGLPPFYVVGDPALVARRAAILRLPMAVAAVSSDEASAAFDRALPVVVAGPPARGEPGRPDATSAPAALASIDRAVEDVFAGRARAVITNPIAKAVLYEAGFSDPGHTEYLARLAARHGQPARRPVMLLWSAALAAIPVTIHEPLRDAIAHLTTDLIVETATIAADDLARLFGIARPRLALSGLNPHAGEGGTLGREDIDIVAPAVARLRAAGIEAVGPLPADTMFHPAARATYDVALCMTHDQALIPVKTLAFDEAVNVTLGLPFVRTSPDHGTAFDLAGTGRGDPASLIAAIRLADRLCPA
jgi:4-hydroxythreonine-4-phosphate dehydrogenase